MLNHKISKLSITLAFLVISPLKATASSFSEFVFFGDSITDTGNVFLATGQQTVTPPFGAIIPSLPYDDTKNFSNGAVWAQYLADFNGLSANPSLAGGSNFAFGGAASQTLPSDISPSPSLEVQLDLWQSTTSNQANPDALYFVQGGGNDIRLTGILPDSEPVSFLQESANSVGGVVQELIDAGATNIAVLNAPDLGTTPEAISGGFRTEATALSQFYNASLDGALDSLDTEGVNLIEVDLFDFITSITDDPTAFGLPANTVTDSSCILPDSVCSNPDEFIFYDGIHPTTVTHLALANVVNQQIQDTTPVPEPSTLLLGLGSVLVLIKRKKQVS